MNLLDKTGLTYFWGKLKAYFATKTELNAKYSKPSGGIPATDLASAVQMSLGKADTALQSYTETDPTVPAWAKAASKPTYVASEITNDVGYVKYVLLQSESDMPANPDSGTLYLIPE